ncbi:MAG: hypothetical protein GY762_16565 [Proteobacteria bacterium]|nr:hypothetical protein [Pseudomonadota bacterium]
MKNIGKLRSFHRQIKYYSDTMFRFAVLALAFTACSTVSYDHEPAHQSPLSRTRWHSELPRKTEKTSAAPTGVSRSETRRMRDRMVKEAEKVLARGEVKDDFGAQDLEAVLDRVGIRTKWQARQGLAELVSLAKRKRAYHSRGAPEVGDVVLFDNQWDANVNGKLDDRFTGCGVVTWTDGSKFQAIVRTGNAPRRIAAWPDGPARRMVDGEKINDFLRVPSRSDPVDTPYLAGQLYVGYIAVDQLAF